VIVPAHRVHGHLDYRRAAEALKAAERVAEVEAELRRSLFDDDAPAR
jgi:hypothetical protein